MLTYFINNLVRENVSATFFKKLNFKIIRHKVDKCKNEQYEM